MAAGRVSFGSVSLIPLLPLFAPFDPIHSLITAPTKNSGHFRKM